MFKLYFITSVMLMTSCSTFSKKNEFTSMTYILQVTKKLGATRADRLDTIRKAKRDIIVIDYAEHGDRESKWAPQEINMLKSSGAKVICYLSIGEAEDYRAYWQKEWKKNPPAFLCEENEDWKGNYKVKYWQKEWQTAILAYLDEIIAQGFDGVYLDIIDGFQYFEHDKENDDWIDHRKNPETSQTFREDMISWVQTISKHGKKTSPNFMIIPQNGSELLETPEYTAIIDAIGIEDLFSTGKKLQHSEHTHEVLNNLKHLQKAGKPILVIEYPKNDNVKDAVKKAAKKHKLPILTTNRALSSLGINY